MLAIAYSYVNELTALSQLDMILLYKVWHVPIHTVLASVAFAQVASDARATWAISQGLHVVSIKKADAAAVYKLKALFSKLYKTF